MRSDGVGPNSHKTMLNFLKRLPGLYAKLCIFTITHPYGSHKDQQTHHVMPQHLYKNKKDARITKKQINVNWNEYTTSSVAHLFLYLIRYVEYNDAGDYQGVILGFRRGTGKTINAIFPSTGEEFKANAFRITIYWLEKLFKEYPDFIENQINFLVKAGRNSGEKRLRANFYSLFQQTMVWKSRGHDLIKQDFTVSIPANFFKKTLLVDLAI